MLIATFGPTTGWVGKTITRDGDVFMLERGGPVWAADVLAYERQGQLSWAADDSKEFVQQFGRFAHDPLAVMP